MRAAHILILNFHGLGSPPSYVDDAEAEFWVSVHFFAQVLDRSRGVAGVRITFDDGNASDFETALPELTRQALLVCAADEHASLAEIEAAFAAIDLPETALDALRDRLGAIDGVLESEYEPRAGSHVLGTIPLDP